MIDPSKVVRSALQHAASVAGSWSPPRPWWPEAQEGEPDARRRPGGGMGGMGDMDY